MISPPPTDLRVFLHLLEQADQLARITVRVDPCLELATVVDQYCRAKGGSHTLLFEQVRGSDLPVVVNLFGEVQRVAWALGTTDLNALAGKLQVALAKTGDDDPVKALTALCADPQLQPVVSSAAAWQELDQTRIGLNVLPQIQAWPGDGGSYLTLGQVITRGYTANRQNCGMYRVQLLDERLAAVRCRAGSGMMQHLAEWHAAGKPMPVAVVLGGPPALTWAAAAPLPPEVDEMAFCTLLSGARMPVTRCVSHDLLVPAGAEVVVEGWIAPGAEVREGPFGNHTGHYDPAAPAPLLTVSRIMARTGAICPWTLVGPPPRENLHMARACATLFMPLLRMDMPTIRALYMPDAGVFHRAALITVEAVETRPLVELAQILRGTALLKDAKLLVVGAADHDPHDAAGVFWRALNRVDRDADLLVENGRITIDARRMPQGDAVRCAAPVLQAVRARWGEYRLGGA